MNAPVNRFVPSLVVALGLLGSTPAHAGMTCDDIMNMAVHNVPASVIVDTIASSGTSFSDADVQCLKQRGAPQEVIAKALQLKVASPQATSEEVEEEPTPQSRFEEEEALGGGDILSQEDVSEEEGGSSGASDLDTYIKQYKAKNYRTASYGLYKLLEENAYPDKDSTIKYYLAKSLHAMEMYHAAQSYYMEVVRKGPRNPLFKHALPRLAQIAAYTGNDYELYRVVGKIAPEAYPRQARPQLYYLMGRKSYEAGDLAEASASFEKVPANHELYPRAQYFQGIINVDREKYKSAVKSFREVIRAEIPTDDPFIVRELEDLKDLSLVNVARIYYKLQKFDSAEAYYAKVDRDSSYWAQSLFERAWTNFFLGDYNETLGLLMTADSPFFSDGEFLPDNQYLRALIYFNLCEYTEVERIVKLFQSNYRPMRNEMKAFIDQYRTDSGEQLFDQAFDAYFGEKASEQTKLPVSLFRKVLRNRDLSSLVRHLDLMDAEVALLQAQTPQWRDSVGKELEKVIAADRQRYRERAGRLFLQSMLDQYRAVDELLQDSDVLLFELADAQRADYVFRMSNPQTDQADEAPIDFATSVDIIYWPFNGEFWKDELAYYRFTEKGSCK